MNGKWTGQASLPQRFRVCPLGKFLITVFALIYGAFYRLPGSPSVVKSKQLFLIFLKGEKMHIVSHGTHFKGTPQGQECTRNFFEILIIFIVQIVVISASYFYLISSKSEGEGGGATPTSAASHSTKCAHISHKIHTMYTETNAVHSLKKCPEQFLKT